MQRATLWKWLMITLPMLASNWPLEMPGGCTWHRCVSKGWMEPSERPFVGQWAAASHGVHCNTPRYCNTQFGNHSFNPIHKIPSPKYFFKIKTFLFHLQKSQIWQNSGKSSTLSNYKLAMRLVFCFLITTMWQDEKTFSPSINFAQAINCSYLGNCIWSPPINTAIFRPTQQMSMEIFP